MNRIFLSVVLLSCLGMACGEVAPSESLESQPVLEQRRDAVINGTALDEGSNGSGKATLHTNDWLVTATRSLSGWALPSWPPPQPLFGIDG